jgi:hypothetical protein
MAGYLLNLTATRPTSGDSADGLFTLNTVDPTSRMWYAVPTGWPGLRFDPGKTPPWPVTVNAPVDTWGIGVPDDGNFQCALEDDIYMRVFLDDSWTPQKGYQVNIAFSAIFGRPGTPGHGGASKASPFRLGANMGPGNTAPQTVFGYGPLPPTTPDGKSAILYLGNIPSEKALKATYSFMVGAYIAYPNLEGWTFGHDPKLQVGGGTRGGGH